MCGLGSIGSYTSCNRCVVFEVLEWLNKHGVIFLNKNTAVGKSLEKSKALQKNFKHFEQVAQVRMTSQVETVSHNFFFNFFSFFSFLIQQDLEAASIEREKTSDQMINIHSVDNTLLLLYFQKATLITAQLLMSLAASMTSVSTSCRRVMMDVDGE